MKHEKTFEAIAKLKDVEIELHRLKNALEMANRALDAKASPVKVVAYDCVCGRKMYFESDRGVIGAKRAWVGLTYDDLPEQFKNDSVFVTGWLWAEEKLKEKNHG